MANIKSQIKRIRTNEAARLRNKSVKSALKTAVRRVRTAARGWTPAGLAVGMALVADLNASVKGAAADPDYALEKAVMDLVAARRKR